jgi:hypothetical protein
MRYIARKNKFEYFVSYLIKTRLIFLILGLPVAAMCSGESRERAATERTPGLRRTKGPQQAQRFSCLHLAINLLLPMDG